MVNTTPLWRQLQAAASVLQAVRSGQSGTAALAAVDAALRPATQALAFAVLRQLGRAQALARLLAQRPPPPPIDALLCTALALAWDESRAPYDVFTLVNQAVEAAKRDRATAAQAGFINGCLRRFLRERAALVAATDDDPTARWSLPPWWLARLRADHPSQWQHIADMSHSAAPMVLRLAPSVGQSYLEENKHFVGIHAGFDATNNIANEGHSVTPLDTAAHRVGDNAWALLRPVSVAQLSGFEDGRLSVQDAAAQLAAPLLLGPCQADGRGLRVLDACAAPGGKTVHLAQMMASDGGEHSHTLLALERDADRLPRIRDNLARCAPSVSAARVCTEVRQADAANTAQWWDGALFDAVLLDAPCTASGIVRRHPDIAWLRRASDVAQLVGEQRRLLDALWPVVRPGGLLLYCTCSVFRAEGAEQAAAFLARNTDAHALPAPGHLLPRRAAPGDAFTENEPSERDGFFYALFQKRNGD
jgi:16S rRNA (cytosine967-C5)-methyltransferase